MVCQRESSCSICFKGTDVVWYEKAANNFYFPWCWRNDWSPFNLIGAHRRSLTRQITQTLNIVNLIENFTWHIYWFSDCLANALHFFTTDHCFSEENNKLTTWQQRWSHRTGFWVARTSKISAVYWMYIRPCLPGNNIASQQEKLQVTRIVASSNCIVARQIKEACP